MGSWSPSCGLMSIFSATFSVLMGSPDRRPATELISLCFLSHRPVGEVNDALGEGLGIDQLQGFSGAACPIWTPISASPPALARATTAAQRPE